VGLVLLVWRWDQLTSPPYWDYAIGLWREANFLVESGFDYGRLMYQEPSVWDGGTRTYGTSLLPGLLALLMTASPSTPFTLITYHLIEIFCAALVVGCVYLMLEPRAGRGVALLLASAAITVPLMSAQVDMVGMELPTTAVAVLAVAVTLRSHYRTGAILGLVASGFKATGALVTMALLGWLGLQGLLAWRIGERARSRRLLAGAAWQLGALAIQISVMLWGGTVQALTVDEHRPMPLTLDNVLNTCPDVAGITILALAATAAAWLLGGIRATTTMPVREWTGGFLDWLESHGCEIVSWMVVLGMWAAIGRIIMIPRYLTLIVPFLACAIGGLAGRSTWWRRGVAVAGGVWLAVNLVNQEGRLFPDLTDQYGGEISRSGALLERSREYLADHQANRRLVRLIEAEYADRPIIAGFPLTLFLGLPRLGYVDRALQGYSIQAASDTATFRAATELLTDLPRDPVFIQVGNSWYAYAAQFAIPQYDEIGEVIFHDRATSPLVAIAQHWPDEVTRDDLTLWYLERMWPGASTTDRFQLEARLWRERGELERAVESLEMAVSEEPRDEALRVELARDLLTLDRVDQAQRAAADALALAPDSAECWYAQSLIQSRQGNRDEALSDARHALELDPKHAGSQKLYEQLMNESTTQKQ